MIAHHSLPPRFGFLDKTNCCQFEVCASLSDRDYLRKVETEPTKLLVLDSEHKLWVWEPTKRGSIPKLFSGFAKRNGESSVLQYTCVTLSLPLQCLIFLWEKA